ncbi:hypothetical protein PCANC_10984 [Puccinia coronata f. sp. avenae]|uniref:Uncharacterized protein n=1 Tax=Puccinia coronata f. sp. avenae TaxID=200324 RepID=A0A2N5UWR6_9BASI|nr:hypothetical protein PCANC_10984 [Puccinia coronata f. sp. avenae]
MKTVYAQLSNLEPSQAWSKISFSNIPWTSITADPAKTNYRTGSSASKVIRNWRTSFIDHGQMLPGSGPSSQLSARPSMKRWRDLLCNGSQSIIKASRSDGHSSSAHFNLADNRSSAPKSDKLIKPSSIRTQELVEGNVLFLIYPSCGAYDQTDGIIHHHPPQDIYLTIKGHPIAQHPAESHSQESATYGSLQQMASRCGHCVI